MSQRFIGAHVSAAGGIENAVSRAADIGCNALQVFSGSPRVWKKPELENFNLGEFQKRKKDLKIEPVFTHALYLVNLASDKSELLEKSKATLKYELSFDSLIEGSGVVVHLGSHQGRGFDAVKEQLAESIAELVANSPENSRFLIENSAGQNGKIASNLDEVKYLLDEVEKQTSAVSNKKLGWCFDTCHAFAAGYALSKPTEDFLASIETAGGLFTDEEHSIKSAPSEITRLELWDSLACIHVNDSKDRFGSGRDRHENLGDGSIPEHQLKSFLALEELLTIPLITEVPGLDNKGPDQENINRLKRLVNF